MWKTPLRKYIAFHIYLVKCRGIYYFISKHQCIDFKFEHYSVPTNDIFTMDRGLTHVWRLFEVLHLTSITETNTVIRIGSL